MKSIYSPRPPIAYQIKGQESCEVSWLLSLPESHAVWNLFWLSVPAVDDIPHLGLRWWTSYKAKPLAAATVVKDVMGCEVLYRKLMMPPHRFVEWFRRAEHTAYESFTLFGSTHWVETVLKRANSVALATAIEGNVIYGRFANQAA